MGRENAAVLPVPVWAQPSKSFPSSATGIACCWIGVGEEYPSVSSDRKMGSIKFNALNDNL